MENKIEKRYAAVTILFVVAMLYITMTRSTAETQPAKLNEFFNALGVVESNNNDDAVGVVGEIGRYQITEAYWQDATDFDSTLGGSYSDCTDAAYSEKIIEAYMLRYASKAWDNDNYYKLARIHNGGWNGVNKGHTKDYAARVMGVMSWK